MERLEQRTLFATDLGVIGPDPLSATGSASATSFVDSEGIPHHGNFPATYRFEVASAVNDVALELTPSGSGASLTAASDADGDGELDAGELATPIRQQSLPGDDVAHSFPLPGLKRGAYFLYVSTDEFFSNFQSSCTFTLRISSQSVPVPEVQVVGAAEIADGDDSPSDPDGTTFGAPTVGDPRPQRTFTVTNTGGSPLTLGAPTVSGPFEIVSGPAATVAPGQSTSFVVEMKTDAVGDQAGTVTFTTDAIGKEEFDFAVSGTVLAKPELPEIVVSLQGGGGLEAGQAESVSFGDVAPGAAASRTFRVHNHGNGTLTLSTQADGDFEVSQAPEGSVAPDGTATVVVAMRTGTPGVKSGQLVITSNDADEGRFVVNLSGTVTAPQPPVVQPDVTAVALAALKLPASILSGDKKAKGSLVATLRNDSGQDLKAAPTVAFQAVPAGDAGAGAIPLRVTTKRLKLRAGAPKLVKGKVLLRSLPPGTYTLTATATANGKTSTVAGPAITVLAAPGRAFSVTGAADGRRSRDEPLGTRDGLLPAGGPSLTLMQ